jgi:hypothetical protein
MSESTARAAKLAVGGLDEVARALARHPDGTHLALITAAAVMAAAANNAPATAAAPVASGAGDGVEQLLRLDFAALLRELQGRGGPAELGRLRIDGSHVYARGVDGNEVRLTEADRSAPVRPPVMRTPDPEPARPASAPAAPARNVPPPAAPNPPSWAAHDAAPTGDGLEID